MVGAFRITAHAIVSADGMIGDATGAQPPSLQFEADKLYFEASLARADVIVNGRNSAEPHVDAGKRRRLVLTHKVASLARDPENPNMWLWNPAGVWLEEACAGLGLKSGTVAVIGGPHVYAMFLKLGYDVFHMSRAPKVRLPGGLPLFGRELSAGDSDAALKAAGLKPGPIRMLDDDVGVIDWTPAR